MICPECGHQVAEQDRYLMERDPDAPMPSWGPGAIVFLVGFIFAGLFIIARLHGA